MSILKKIKSVFIVPEEVDQASLNKNGELISTTPVSTNTEELPDQDGKERFYQILSEVLDKNNLPGFDYIEFKKAVRSILEMHQMEEQAAYKTAFATAQAMNVNASHLIDSAQKYLSILETEEASFSHSAQSFLTRQLSNRDVEKQSLDKELIQIRSELDRLQKLLVEKESRLAALQSETESVQAKFDQNKINFSAAYHSIVSQIKEDVEKMKKYLS